MRRQETTKRSDGGRREAGDVPFRHRLPSHSRSVWSERHCRQAAARQTGWARRKLAPVIAVPVGTSPESSISDSAPASKPQTPCLMGWGFEPFYDRSAAQSHHELGATLFFWFSRGSGGSPAIPTPSPSTRIVILYCSERVPAVSVAPPSLPEPISTDMAVRFFSLDFESRYSSDAEEKEGLCLICIIIPPYFVQISLAIYNS